MEPIDLNEHREQKNGRAPEWAAARRALGHAVPPDKVEAQLMQAFARRHPKQPWYRRWSQCMLTPWVSVGAMGCMLAIAVAALHPAGPLQPRQQRVVAAVADDGFLMLASADRIQSAAHPQLKQADLPRQLLVQLGIPIANDAPDELIHAEVLLADTGEPLAIRLAVN
ncbi:hypothetical protein [Massilia horti]|uniref:Uncharacterized protein n=1 Tax=Massilia horti TaxID=2562153 RepID=A0A4Y9T4Y4_9BURK|nr:hypothetical protein [Massilia horti]TFW35661.1 hypothetical protein E4O92_01505 [Massilia horti]